MIGKIIDRVFAVAGAIAFMQIPQYMQAYTLSLAGRVAELSYQVDQITHAAKKSGKTLQEFIQKFQSSTDADFSSQGFFMEGMVKRLTELSDALAAIQTSNPFFRPFTFLSHFNYDISQTALKDFQFGLSLSWESLIFALLGMLFGMGAYALLRKIGSLFTRDNQSL